MCVWGGGGVGAEWGGGEVAGGGGRGGKGHADYHHENTPI